MKLRNALSAACLTLFVSTAAAQTGPTASLWTRIVDGMRLPNAETADTVAKAERYARRPDLIEATLRRSEPYLWHIVEAADRRGMPLDVALLPAIESAFDAQAHSHQQAAGIWQFVPTTGAAFGLNITRAYDARRDPIASTQAALGHLSDMYEYFNDWWLAVAAYNAGVGNLSRALRNQNPDVGIWKLRLPKETYTYVRRLAAIGLIVKQPERFGITLPDVVNRPVTATLRLREPINLEAAARKAGVSLERVRSMNPGLGRLDNTTSKSQVLLPIHDAARLRAALATQSFPPQPIPTVVEHVIKPGDSLWRIARNYKVSVRDLTRWNDLKESSVLRPGKRLHIELPL